MSVLSKIWNLLLWGTTEPDKPPDYIQEREAEIVREVQDYPEIPTSTAPDLLRLEEPYIGYKVAKADIDEYPEVLLTLVIPDGARVVIPDQLTRPYKLRTDVVYTVKIEQIFGDKYGRVSIEDVDVREAYPALQMGSRTTYEIGEETRAHLDTSLSKKCTNGLHFFSKKQQAIEYAGG